MSFTITTIASPSEVKRVKDKMIVSYSTEKKTPIIINKQQERKRLAIALMASWRVHN